MRITKRIEVQAETHSNRERRKSKEEGYAIEREGVSRGMKKYRARLRVECKSTKTTKKTITSNNKVHMHK